MEPTARKGAESHTLAAKDSARVLVTVAGVGDDHVLAVEAVHGSVDEPLVVIATPPPPSAWSPPPPPPPPATAPTSTSTATPTPTAAPTAPEAPGEPGLDAPVAATRERVDVTISGAFVGGEAPIPLRLTDPITGQQVTTIEIAAGQHVLLRLSGDGFAREATYRANLTLFGAEPSAYRVRIRSTSPYRPLGLRAAKWADTFSNVPILQRKAVSLVLPVDSVGDEQAPYHVVVKPPAQPEDNTKPLPACGIVVRPMVGRGDAVVVELPPLDPGRYIGTLEIQGESLAVDVTLKNSFWWVWLLVAAGAGLSLGLREYVRYRAAREAAERKIAAKEREIDKKREGMLAWDELVARNVLRQSRGRKSYLRLEDIDEVLADVMPRERGERAAIDRALADTPLPTQLRTRLRAKLERLSYLCSRADAAEIDRGLVELARSAQAGFSSELQAWLGELRETHLGVAARIAPLLLREKLHKDTLARARVEAAMNVLGALIEDARALVLDTGLSTGQAEMLSMLGSALAQIEAWVRDEHVPSGIVAIVHCDLGAISKGSDATSSQSALHAPIPHGLRLRARGVGRELNAQEEISFELVVASGDLESAARYEPPQPVTWLVDRGEAVARGGGKLTYVFQASRLWGLRSRTVVVKLGDRVLAEWRGTVLPAERSVAAIERIWASGARFAATLVGVIVAGAAAVALYWSGKPFGGGADYVAALLTGLGADLTVVAGGGKLLQSVLDALTKRREDE